MLEITIQLKENKTIKKGKPSLKLGAIKINTDKRLDFTTRFALSMTKVGIRDTVRDMCKKLKYNSNSVKE